jgi:hypothetical protein
MRFEELKGKFTSEEDGRVRNWFKQIKDHVTRDKRMDQASEGCPGLRLEPWRGGNLGTVAGGDWRLLYHRAGRRPNYAEMCRDQDAGDAFRRAPYLRPLDFYWSQLKPEKVAEIQMTLSELVKFLDMRDAQTSEKPERFLSAEA